MGFGRQGRQVNSQKVLCGFGTGDDQMSALGVELKMATFKFDGRAQRGDGGALSSWH